MRSGPLPFYPVAFAIYPPLALAAENAGELLALCSLVTPIVASAVVALAALTLLSRIIREVHKRALIATVVSYAVTCYGYFKGMLSTIPALSPLAADDVALPIWGLLALSVSLQLYRVHWPLRGSYAFLNLTSLILLTFPAYTLAAHRGFGDAPPAVPEPLVARASDDPRASVRPDIYFLMLDKYTGSSSLRTNYEFDNGPFEARLRDRGFFVAAHSRTNYVHTFQVLASMLNWEYLDSPPREGPTQHEYLHSSYERIESNRTWQFLKQRGYRFVFFPTGLPATARNRLADVQLPDPRYATSEFQVAWLHTTVAPVIARWRCRVVRCIDDAFPYTPEPAARIDWKFQRLATLPGSPGPLFVFAHILVPHEPYIYNADCSHRTAFWPANDFGINEPKVKHAYVAQLICVNRKVLQLIDQLIRRSPTPPVIILQSDHGHGRLGRVPPPFHQARRENVRERVDIFAAYHLPAGGEVVVHDSISPVNVFRGVLRHYFGANLPPLEDITYWSAWEEPYRFTRIP
ncbi:MAG: hypothetical protein ACREMX_00400 [Gemmatimonadales bacterium]